MTVSTVARLDRSGATDGGRTKPRAAIFHNLTDAINPENTQRLHFSRGLSGRTLSFQYQQ